MRRTWWPACVLLLTACKEPSDRDDTTETSITTLPMTQTMPTTSGSSDDTGQADTLTPEPTTGTGTSEPGDTTSGFKLDMGEPSPDLPPEPLPPTELWYSVADLLVYIEIDPLDGSVVQLVTSTINNNPSLAGDLNSCGLTMLEDGSLLGSRGNTGGTRLFHIQDPPKVAGNLDVTILGQIPGAIYVEALHTDCDGRVYLMDTGVDSVSNDGNRLLRFNADYLAGVFSYDVITDLSDSVSVDIDDMAPGISENGNIRDNPGFGIDSGSVYALDYTDGTGNLLGLAGTYGIHALGGPLFMDGKSRLYVLDVDANLFEADPVSLALSAILVTGPALMNGDPPGDTGLAGPLTDCVTGFPPG